MSVKENLKELEKNERDIEEIRDRFVAGGGSTDTWRRLRKLIVKRKDLRKAVAKGE